VTELLLASSEDVRRYARGAIKAAGADEVLPVPLDDIVEAVGLHKENLFELGDTSLPDEILRIARRLSGKVVGAFARREKTVYVDLNQSAPRGRFTLGHELGHSALPWHDAFYHVDDPTTLNADTKIQLEQEANLFAAEVIFGLERFTTEADSFRPSISVPLSLAKNYGTSNHATLRRYAAQSRRPLALITLGQHVKQNPLPHLPVWTTQCESSATFNDKYGTIAQLVGDRILLAEHPCAATLAGMNTQLHDEPTVMRLNTARGSVEFIAHLFFNRHSRFLLLHESRRHVGPRVRVLPA
jgi:Zn-dependent peptidase ImmA (M78 family)